VPYVTLTEAGADFTVHNMNSRSGALKTPEYLRLNPKHKVPVLVIDGEPLTENVAIQIFIHRNFPQAKLLPQDPKQEIKAISLMAWFASTIHPPLTPNARPENYCDLPGSADAVKRAGNKLLFEDFKIIFNYSDTKSYINKMLHFDQMTLLPALLQIEDRVSMAVSIESRVPLLDYRIADLVNCMPPALKFQGGRTKYILKEVVHDLLPEKITNRKDKMGFPVPLEEWMRGGIVRDFVCDTLLSKKSIKRGIYREQALKNMIDQSGVSSRQLWGAFSLELWHQAFIDD
jgi:hypothetical protein